MAGELRQSDDIEEVADAFLAFTFRNVTPLKQGVLDVLRCREHRQKIERLEDETDRSAAQIGEFVRAPTADVLIVDEDLAATWRVDATDEVQQRRLPAARWTGDRQKDTRIEGQSDVLQCLDFLIAKQIILVYVF